MESWQSLAYCTGLENRRTRKCSEGSNPSLSAKIVGRLKSLTCNKSRYAAAYYKARSLQVGYISGSLRKQFQNIRRRGARLEGRHGARKTTWELGMVVI